MIGHFINGLRLVFTPGRAWVDIGDQPYSPLAMALFTLGLSGMMFFFRSLGGLLMGMSFPWFMLEGLLFSLICIGVSLTIGLLLIPCARFARRPVNDGHAMKLALFSATPLWFWSFFQVLPFGFVRTGALLLSLAHCCVILFKGLPEIFGTEPMHTLLLALIASTLWILGLALFTQVFLGVAFAL